MFTLMRKTFIIMKAKIPALFFVVVSHSTLCDLLYYLL